MDFLTDVSCEMKIVLSEKDLELEGEDK